MSAQWRLTAHARERAWQIEARVGEIVAVLDAPELDTCEPDPRHRRAVAGRLVVVYNPTDRAVVTVIPRSVDGSVVPRRRADGKLVPDAVWLRFVNRRRLDLDVRVRAS